MVADRPQTPRPNGRPPKRTRPVRRAPKVAVFVAQDIVNEIVNGDYEQGHRLAPEPQMLKTYGVARGTLREALRILEQNGVVKVRSGPGGGPLVQAPNARYLASTLALLMQMHRAPIKQVVSARTVLEPIVASLAATAMTDADIAALGSWLELMRRNIEDAELFLESNDEFHRLIAVSSGNALFCELVQACDHILDGKFAFDYPMRAREAVVRAHEAIYEALRDRDPQAARTAMERHLGEMQTFMMARHTEHMDSPVRWQDVKDY